jgi:hypothetical protein
MNDEKNSKDKIGKINRSGATSGVKGISEIEKVKAAQGVKGVSAVSGVRGAGNVNGISFEQRDKLLRMVSEESAKLAAQGVIPAAQREIVEKAVQMVIDAALIEPVDESNPKKE